MQIGSVAMVQTLERHRFTVDDYHRMVEAGILTENDRVELLRGEIVVMAPVGSRHASCVDNLDEIFAALRPRARPRNQNPITLPPDHEPEPDFVLAVPHAHRFADRHPAPADVLLVIEVADTTQTVDREVKGPLYAENGIREYWLVDLAAGRIEVYGDPVSGGTYRLLRKAGPGETLTPLAFPDFEVRVDEVLP